MPLKLDGTIGVTNLDGSAAFPAIRGTTSANNGIFFGANTVSVSTSGTEQMRVDANGNVGIGTATPSALLHVNSTASIVRPLVTATTGYVDWQVSSTGGNLYVGIDNSAGGISGTAYGRHIYSDGAYPLDFFTNATQRMRIDSSGNVGIGTSSPSSKLHVKDTNSFTTFIFENANNTVQYTGPYLNLRNTAVSANYGEVSLQHVLMNTSDLTDVNFQIQQRTIGGSFINNIYGFSFKNQYHYWFTSGSERMRIDSAGAVNVVTGPIKINGNQAVNGPAFMAYASGATSLTGNAATKVLFATSLFDTNSCYSTSTSRFTPTVAGYYQITARVRADVASNQVLNAQIYKNGSVVLEGSFINVVNGQEASIVTGVVYMNGSTDYLEVYCYSGPQTASTTATQSSTFFCGCMLRGA